MTRLINIFSGDEDTVGYQPQPNIKGQKSKVQKAVEYLASQADKTKDREQDRDPASTSNNSALAMKLNNQLRKKEGLKPRSAKDIPGNRLPEGPSYPEDLKSIKRKKITQDPPAVVKLKVEKTKREKEAIKAIDAQLSKRLERTKECGDGSCSLQGTRNKLETKLVEKKAAKKQKKVEEDFESEFRKNMTKKKTKKASGSKTSAKKKPKKGGSLYDAESSSEEEEIVEKPAKRTRKRTPTSEVPKAPVRARKRAPTRWNIHMAKVSEKHKGKSFIEIMAIAKKT